MAELRWGLSAPHGYNRYSYGCRCETCREAKAEYMRQSRDRRRRTRDHVKRYGSGGRNFVDGIVHGYNGYQNWACRCDVCVAGRTERYHEYVVRKRKDGA